MQAGKCPHRTNLEDRAGATVCAAGRGSPVKVAVAALHQRREGIGSIARTAKTTEADQLSREADLKRCTIGAPVRAAVVSRAIKPSVIAWRQARIGAGIALQDGEHTVCVEFEYFAPAILRAAHRRRAVEVSVGGLHQTTRRRSSAERFYSSERIAGEIV